MYIPTPSKKAYHGNGKPWSSSIRNVVNSSISGREAWQLLTCIKSECKLQPVLSTMMDGIAKISPCILWIKRGRLWRLAKSPDFP
jgi:hypothetical protein